MTHTIWPGNPHPLGATWDGKGTNFAIFSENATTVYLCLFDDNGHETQIKLPELSNYIWHGYIPGLQPGQRYAYRVEGPYDPEDGQRFNCHKLLLDPYAQAIAGDIEHGAGIFGYPINAIDNEDRDLEFVHVNDIDLMPQCVVVDMTFDWEGDRHPDTPWHETIIYEAHVKGLTQCHPDVPEKLRGTYAGVGHPAIVEHLKSLGITAIELLPVHHFTANPGHLVSAGLRR